jgi:DNA modification methylase
MGACSNRAVPAQGARRGAVIGLLNRTHLGDCRELMQSFAGDGLKVQCIVTSPPYWGLRDYDVRGQIGLERTWQRHVAVMRGVFRLAREILADDGVLWLNYGDSYHSPRTGGSVGANSTINGQRTLQEFRRASRAMKSRIRPPDVDGPNRRRQQAIKAKDLRGMPWRVAFALQADGWYLRSDVVWHKTNPMPESVYDRPTKCHEYVFLLSKSEHYHYDASAIAEPRTGNAHGRGDGVNPKARRNPRVAGWADGAGSHSPKDHARTQQDIRSGTKFGREAGWRTKQNESFSGAVNELVETRNIRSVWTFPTQPFEGAHFATFPEELVKRCILAGSRPGDVVFDPFHGSGTVGAVARSLGRQFIGIELNPSYIELEHLRGSQLGMGI